MFAVLRLLLLHLLQYRPRMRVLRWQAIDVALQMRLDLAFGFGNKT